MPDSTAAVSEPLNIAGVKPARWLFGVRIWITMMLALYVAFWLQLDGASSAATCVAILALPTRGQAYEKAFYRLLATVVGVSASIAITGLFAQTRELFIPAFAGWLGLCVYLASLFDGSRAYGFVLSGYTVAIVSVTNIDAPERVWSSGLNRGAAIAIGVACVALVGDLFAVPEAYGSVQGSIRAAREKALGFARAALSGRSAEDDAAVDVFASVLALHPQMSVLSSESISGRDRAMAMGRMSVAMVEETIIARALARHPELAQDMHHAATALGDEDAARRLRMRLDDASLDAPASSALPLCAGAALAEADRLATISAAEFMDSQRPDGRVRTPLFRSKRHAAYKAARLAVAVSATAVPLVYSSWPETSELFASIGIIAALGSTTPDINAFARGALVSLPLAILLSGVTQFLVLDGVDAFPLLCIAMAPLVIGSCLLVSSPKPSLNGMGFLLLVYVPVLLSLSNPQTYNPQTFLVSSLLTVAAVVMLNVLLIMVPPADDAMRRRWLVRSAIDDIRAVVKGHVGHLTPSEAAYRAADRIGQLAALQGPGAPEHGAALDEAFRLAEVEGVLRRARQSLEEIDRTPERRVSVRIGKAALDSLEPGSLMKAARRLDATPDATRAAAILLHTITIIQSHGADLRRWLPA